MSIWIRVLCTIPDRSLTAEAMSHGLDDADFAMMAEWQDLEVEVGYEARRRLTVEEVERGQSGWAMLIRYQPQEAGPFIHVDCWTGDRARGEADEIGEMLETRTDPASCRVRALLPAVQETLAFCLKQSHIEGMGWPIAFHMAMWLAKTGQGLVDADGVWWDPVTYTEI